MHRATLVSLATFALTLLASIATPAEPNGGAVEHSVTVDGISRNYLVFAPKRFDKPLPMVLALHGGGSNARQMERYTRFNDLAAKEGFLVVYPEAVDGNWNDGRGIAGVRAQQENIDDVKFVRTILDRISKVHRIDRSRIYTSSTGILNGAFMSHRLATEASDLITAIAPVVGGMAPAMAKRFHPDQSVSILVIQGDADPLVPIRGGMVGFPRGRKQGEVLPTRGDNLPLPAAERQPGRFNRDDLGSRRAGLARIGRDQEVLPDGPGGVRTQVYVVRNGGHTGLDARSTCPKMLIGKASQEFSATEVIWEFFKSCPPRLVASSLQEL